MTTPEQQWVLDHFKGTDLKTQTRTWAAGDSVVVTDPSQEKQEGGIVSVGRLVHVTWLANEDEHGQEDSLGIWQLITGHMVDERYRGFEETMQRVENFLLLNAPRPPNQTARTERALAEHQKKFKNGPKNG
jgi:hypothetical protein